MASQKNKEDIVLTDFENDYHVFSHVPADRKNGKDNRKLKSPGNDDLRLLTAENDNTDSVPFSLKNIKNSSDPCRLLCYLHPGSADCEIIAPVSDHELSKFDTIELSPTHIISGGVDISAPAENDEYIAISKSVPDVTEEERQAAENLFQRLCKYLRGVSNWRGLHDDDRFNWTLVQAWHNVAYISGVVPCRMTYIKETDAYQLTSFIPQKVLYSLRNIFLLLDVWRDVPTLFNTFAGPPTPLSFLQAASAVTSLTLNVSFLKTTCFDNSKILQVQEQSTIITRNGDPGKECTSYVKSRKLGVVGFVGLLGGIVLALIIETLLNTLQYHDIWKGEPAIFLQAFSCYIEEAFYWKSNCDTDAVIYNSMSDLSTEDVVRGLLGYTIFICGTINHYHIVFVILSSCLDLIFSTYCLKRNAEIPLLQTHKLLKDQMEKISNYVGGLLMCFMLHLALGAPSLILEMFSRLNPVATIVAVIKLIMNVSPLIAGSVAALLVDQLQESFEGEENVEELPQEPRRLATFLFTIFVKPTGIGYKGLFALNFKLLFGYALTVGGILLGFAEAIKP